MKVRGQKGWHGVKWIINVDIKGYFDNIDHEILISLLEKRIDDKRFINLIKLMLKAGCIEDWNHHGTYTGTPQGGIISPLLSNIYLHEMDIFAEKLKCEFDAGKGRRRNAVYRQYESIIHKGWKRIGRVQDAGGDEIEVARIRQQISDAQSRQRQVHYGDPFDPTYRRLHYCRYADDFTIGIIGNKAEAAGIFNKVKEFINGSLNLEISEEKSGISHFEKGFEYLGYVVASNVANKLMKVRNLGGVALKRTIRGAVTLQVPTRVGLSFAKNHGYIRAKDHRATHINTLLRRSDEEIILTYNAEFRGLALYYALAKDVKRKLGWLEYVKTGSMLATLAAKHKSSMNKMHKMLSDNGELVYKTQVKGKTKRLVVYKLKHLKVPGKSARVDVEPNVSMFKHSRTEIIDRLNAGKCEYCRKTKGYFEVHHKNKLKDTAPGIERALASMRRKTIVLCVECHHKLHAGTLPDMRFLGE